MSSPSLAPPILVADEGSLGQLVRELAAHPIVAVDTESNSLHAYRERVCLIQFSTPDADYIVDPIRVIDLSGLGPFLANPEQQKVFHAAEYDVVCLKRDYRFEIANIFDTMSAARTLGWPQVGLADILATHFGVTMNKKYQRADWKRRPLTAEQLDYARLDTHYLLALRERQVEALTQAGGWAEAHEEFERLSRLGGDENAGPGLPTEALGRTWDPAAFWRVKGARELGPGQSAVLQAVFAYREQQAERIDVPPFKVMGEATLLELARRAPRTAADLQAVAGMTPDQVRRYGQGLLAAIEAGLTAPGQQMPPVARESDEVRDRYDRLHTWRKNRAKARGVESDVILPRTALWDLARRPPGSLSDLEQVADFGPWRREQYGREILAVIARAGGSK